MVKKIATFLLVILFFIVIGCGSSKDEQEIKDVVQKFWISYPQRNLDSLIESVNARGKKFFDEEIADQALREGWSKIEVNSFYDGFFGAWIDGFKKDLDNNKISYSEDDFNYPAIKPHSIKELSAKADVYVKDYLLVTLSLDKENGKWKTNVNPGIDSVKKDWEKDGF